MTQKPPVLIMMQEMTSATISTLSKRFTLIFHHMPSDADLTALAERYAPLELCVTNALIGASAALFERLPHLKLLVSYGVGVERIDLGAARRRGVAVANTPDVLTHDVADFAFALLLAVTRRVAEGDRLIRRGRWTLPGGGLGLSLRGKTLGLLGLGRIGKEIARRAAAFDMSVGYVTASSEGDQAFRRFRTTVALAKQSDFLIVCAAGGAGTARLVDAAVINALGPSGVLINIARGSIVDESALLEALTSGRLAAAALDVFEKEPATDNPLARLDNVVLTPHIGSATAEARSAMAELVARNLIAFADGQLPVTLVEPASHHRSNR